MLWSCKPFWWLTIIFFSLLNKKHLINTPAPSSRILLFYLQQHRSPDAELGSHVRNRKRTSFRWMLDADSQSSRPLPPAIGEEGRGEQLLPSAIGKEGRGERLLPPATGEGEGGERLLPPATRKEGRGEPQPPATTCILCLGSVLCLYSKRCQGSVGLVSYPDSII
jgi:hypothetical protein